jgi:ATP-dependent DNA ligase
MGLPVFDLLRYRQHDRAAVLCAIDLIELDGEDLRRAPVEHRKRALANLLRQKRDGIRPECALQRRWRNHL